MDTIWPDRPVGSQAPHLAASAAPRWRAGGSTLADERHAIEARNPGWHVWVSDAGKPWATRRPDGTGQEATVTASHITQMDRAIAEFEHEFRQRYHTFSGMWA